MDMEAIDAARDLGWTEQAQAAVRTLRVELETRAKGTTWRRVQRGGDGDAWLGRVRGQPIQVLWSVAEEEDGQVWLHVSASHRSRIPTWEEMAAVKEFMVGSDRWAAQLHPPETDYVNIHGRVLHLWSPLSHWPLPDFTRGTESV